MPLHGICINPNAPLNWQCPWNRGLVSMWLNLPQGVWGGGRTWRDLNRASLNDGTLTNMSFPPTSTSGWGGTTRPGGWGEVRFDGVNDQSVFTTVASLKPTAALSYSVWLRTTSLSTAQQAIRGADSVVVGDYGFTLSLSAITTGKYLFALRTSTDNILEVTIPDTGWHHVCATYDGAAQRLYVDGAQKATQAATGAVSYGSGGFLVGGANSSTPTLPFSGAMDNIRIRNVAASAAEVAALYADSATGYRRTLNWVRPRAYGGAATGNRRRRYLTLGSM